jgi:hypothetical protein
MTAIPGIPIVCHHEMGMWLGLAGPQRRCAWELLCAYLELWDRNAAEFYEGKAKVFHQSTLQQASARALFHKAVGQMFDKHPVMLAN